MKWQNLRKSDNVEVDCLGERTNLNSPEASAAFACQEEVSRLREQFAQGSTEKGDQFDQALMMYLKQSDAGSGGRQKPLTAHDIRYGSPNLNNPAERPPNFAETVDKFKRELPTYLILSDLANNPPPTPPRSDVPLPPRRPRAETPPGQTPAEVPLPPRRPKGK